MAGLNPAMTPTCLMERFPSPHVSGERVGDSNNRHQAH